jgi:hypothetical protein
LLGAIWRTILVARPGPDAVCDYRLAVRKLEATLTKAVSILIGVTTTILALAASPAVAQSTDDLSSLRKDVDALKEGQKAIQSDLQEIKNLLRARPAATAPAPEVALSVEGAPFKGDKKAKLTLVDFTDYQ